MRNVSPTPSMAARISNCTSSTTKGPSTATASDCMPLSNSQRYVSSAPCRKLRHRCFVRSRGDYVALDEFPEVDAGVEVTGDEIHAHLIRRRDVDDDVGVGMSECPELR